MVTPALSVTVYSPLPLMFRTAVSPIGTRIEIEVLVLVIVAEGVQRSSSNSTIGRNEECLG
jgi:hypothetical protein